ncbi:MAG: radical SAM family heme chaperone HemW [Isosphaeraceae bacterium]
MVSASSLLPADLRGAPPWIWPRAAYIHIPFCAHKCGYCDFASLAGSDHHAGRYLAALEREIADALKSPQPVETVFIGGGTPTRLSAPQLLQLVCVIQRWLPLTPGGEWTVEANPGTLDTEKVDVLAQAGVNRVSLGAQSFQPRLLRALERNHEPAEVVRAVSLLQDKISRWSLDLIFGIPGSLVSDCRADLEEAISLGPRHLSCYGLVYEKGTSLWKQWQAGHVQAVEEEVERAMFDAVIDRLGRAGMVMYEISNHAFPGDESRHNLVYWTNDAYFGFGLGAARYIDGVRSVNTRDLEGYLKRIEAGEPAVGPSERLDPEARARETAMLMLRRTVLGIQRDDFRLRTDFELDELAGAAVRRFVDQGLLDDDGSRVRLTREGLFLADHVLRDLL